MTDPTPLVLDDDAPTVVIQNDLLRYLFSDDEDGDGVHVETQR